MHLQLFLCVEFYGIIDSSFKGDFKKAIQILNTEKQEIQKQANYISRKNV